jgi:prepilin-type N-terminal cleavage/methylation domain-containing protein
MLQKTKHNQSGFSLIEAMVATLIMAITFTGVYTLTNYSSITLKNSVDRQKMQIIANQMIESITIDYANIDSYNNMDFTTCNAPTVAQTQDYHQNRYRWCRMLNDAVGTPAIGDIRNIVVTTASGKKTLHITLESRRKGAQIVIKNAYE